MRLDQYLVNNLGIENRSKAGNMIKLGKVTVNGITAVKCGQDISTQEVKINSLMDFESMGGYKLDKAIKEFGISVSGLKAVDIGASNGGFTDCLLRNGVAEVYAVDVGECAFGEKLRFDRRVKIRDKQNARDLTLVDINGEADLIVIDVSFISLKYILENMYKLLKFNGEIIALVKPQFEVGKKYLSKKGIVNDIAARENALKNVTDYAISVGLTPIGLTTAPIREKKNIEYLLRLRKYTEESL